MKWKKITEQETKDNKIKNTVIKSHAVKYENIATRMMNIKVPVFFAFD